MRRLLPALVAILIFLPACTDVQSEERELERAEATLEKARERAEEGLEKARERIAEARERVEDARDDLRDVREDWAEPSEQEVEDALEDLGVSGAIGRVFEDVGRALQNDSDVQPVDGRELRTLLPDETEGFEQYNSNSESSGGFGIRVSHATGEYRNGDAELQINIVDTGTLKGAIGEALTRFDAYNDQESDRGYRRTTDLKGYPAYVTFREGNRRDEMEAVVVVEERFIVRIEAKGRSLSDDLMEEVLDDISIRQLKRLAD